MGKELRYAISDIHIERYENIRDVQIKGIPTNSKWIFVTGEYFKDTFLQAIALGLSKGSWLLGSYLLSVGVKCKENNEYVCHKNVQLPDKKIETPSLDFNVAAYGIYRALNFCMPYEKSSIANLFNKRNVIFFEEYLTTLFRLCDSLNGTSKPDLRAIESEIKGALQTITRLVSFISEITDFYLDSDNGHEVIYIIAGIQYKYGELPINTKFTLNFVFDILVILSNGCVSDNFNEIRITEPNTLHGIVIIDSLETNLSPKQQHKLVECLDNLFPNVQFVVSTNSPIPILAAPKNSAFIKVENDKETGVFSAKLLDINVSVLMPNAILTSPLFDFQDIISIAYNEKDALETNCDYFEIMKIQQRRERLGIVKRTFNDSDLW